MIEKNKIIETLKMLIYKESPDLLEKLDFDDDDTFLEPLLFSYFNNKNDYSFSEKLLSELLSGYYTADFKTKIEESFNKEGIAYIPRLGYFKKGEQYPFEEIKYISETNIELLQYQIKNLQFIFRDLNNNIIDQNKIVISKFQNIYFKESLTNSLFLIKKYSPNHYYQIEQNCKKIILFSTPSRKYKFICYYKCSWYCFFKCISKGL